jgi:tRNA (guanine-N7-)-methyltransferase
MVESITDHSISEFPQTQSLRRGIRTFKPRRSRITKSQQHAVDNPQALLIDFQYEFLNWPHPPTPLYLDIGFGNGASTLGFARQEPDSAFLAVDVHTPGVGDLLSELHEQEITNVRVMETDAIAVLENMIRPGSLAGIYTLFPDPWQKARHHKRRIVQQGILDLMHSRLTSGGFWHIATDWPHYAESISELFARPSNTKKWSSGKQARPERAVTRYEERAIFEGRAVTDFHFLVD